MPEGTSGIRILALRGIDQRSHKRPVNHEHELKKGNLLLRQGVHHHYLAEVLPLGTVQDGKTVPLVAEDLQREQFL